MYTTVQRWGNSNAVRIPKALLEAVQLAENDKVEITAQEGGIFIQPAKRKRRIKSLEELFEGYEGDYICEEFDWGSPVGREVW